MDKSNPIEGRCTELVSDSWGSGYQCQNSRKYGDKCGTHDPDMRAAREKARGPNQADREWTARREKRERVDRLELENAVLTLMVADLGDTVGDASWGANCCVETADELAAEEIVEARARSIDLLKAMKKGGSK